MLATAQEVARKVTATHRGLFDAFPEEVADDDLVQECLAAIVRGSPHFDLAKAAWSTCAGRTAHFRLIDFHRAKVSQRKNETIRSKSAAQPDSVTSNSDEIIHIAERAAEVAAKMMPAYAPRGNHDYTLYQLAAVIALKTHLGATWRGIVLVLEKRVDVRERIGLRRLPSHMTLQRARRRIRRAVRQLRKSRHEQQVTQARTREPQAV